MQVFMVGLIYGSMQRVLSSLLISGVVATARSSSSPLRNFHTTMAGRPYVINPKKQHRNTIIFLHGLGDNGAGWSDMFGSDINHDYTKIICPNSESRRVTLNMGMAMPAWFDLFGLSPNDPEDSDGIAAACRLVHGMIDAEIQSGIDSKRIVLGGFSMGGALALYSGLTYGRTLGGIIGLSSFLLQRNRLPGNSTANLETPIFLGHGTNDFLVPLTFGQLTEEKIKSFNQNVELHTYPGLAHSSSPQEMRDVQTFLNKALPQ